MSTFSGDLGREEEDGGGWGGLMPEKGEREVQKRERYEIDQWFVESSTEYPGLYELRGVYKSWPPVEFYLVTTPCGRICLRKKS